VSLKKTNSQIVYSSHTCLLYTLLPHCSPSLGGYL